MKRIVRNTIKYMALNIAALGGCVGLFKLIALFPHIATVAFTVSLGVLSLVFMSWFFAKLDEECLPPENENTKTK